MKLSTQSLQINSSRNVFLRGEELYTAKKFNIDDINKSFDEQTQIIKYEGIYSGKYEDYKVIIEVKTDDVIQKISCTCPMHIQYNGLCKHIIAMALCILYSYNNSNHRLFIENAISKIRIQENYNKLQIIKKSINKKYNNSDIVRIQPLILIDVNNKNKVILHLRVGIDRMYIIRDVYDFLNRVIKNEKSTYGKLEFVHSISVFDEKSKRLVRLLLNNRLYTDTAYSRKDYILSEVMIDELFQIYKNDILYADNGINEIFVADKELEIKFEISDEKIVFENKEKISIIKGLDDYYVLYDNNFYKVKKQSNNYYYSLFVYIYENNEFDISGIEEDFKNDILPMLYKNFALSEETKNKYEISEMKIDSYFDYEGGCITLNPKIFIGKDEFAFSKDFLNNNYFNIYLNEIKNIDFNIVQNKIIIEDPEKIKMFLYTSLDMLKIFGDVYLDESIKKITIKKLKSVRMSVSYGIDMLNLSVHSDDLTDTDISEIVKGYKKKKKYVKLKNNTIIEIDQEVEKLCSIIEELDLDTKKVTQVQKRPLFNLLKINQLSDDISYDDKILEILHNIINYKDFNCTIPSEVTQIIRNYQIDGLKWLKMLTYYGFGGILADDMGLGKTLEMICHISGDTVNKPSLVVCPTSLIYNWYNEIKKWNFTIKCIPISGSAKTRKEIIENIDENDKIIYVTSYDSLKRDIDIYTNTFRFIIIDEAQFIKNQYTLKANAVKILKSEVNFALTGTPIENSLADLWSIFDFIMPNYLSNYQIFKEKYEKFIMEKDEESLNALVKKVSPFIMRRTKKDVLSELPDKIENVYYLDMNDKQRKIYDAYLLSLKKELSNDNSEFLILQMLTRLRQICVDPSLFLDDYNEESTKMESSISIIKEATMTGHKVLVFSQFTTALSIIGNKLDNEGIKYYTITGQTKSIDRIFYVDSFNQNDDVKVFLISLKAGGTGLNLHTADIVLHIDPWWNISAENQASDRAHRIGQVNTVQVIKLICRNTIEQKVLELQVAKKELADSIINNQVESLKKLTKDDIKYILS